MIQHQSFIVEPWSLHEAELRLDLLAQSESLFALSNGHIGIRGNLDEGEPHGLPGTYLNGFYELRPLPYAESQYGSPESSQTLVNVTNGKLIRLLVDDEPFDVRYGELRSHDRVLDFRAGTLRRTVEWTSPAGRTVRVTSTRFVSLTHRAIFGINYELETLDGPANIVIQSELVANEQLPISGEDPRVAAAIESPLESEEHRSRDRWAVLIHRTRLSGLRMAAAMDHKISGTSGMQVENEASPNSARIVITDVLEPGQRLSLFKLVAYGWSLERTLPALRDQVAAALAAARKSGLEGLLAEQRKYLDSFWDHADVELSGDSELQQAVRFALFHVLQAGARAERRAIPAKGLTGTGYDGHTFWDEEMFIMPVLTYTLPEAAADALRWRHSTLPQALQRAHELGLSGAAFPWRTIHGEECSGYWPAGTAAFHVNADIADATIRYVEATGEKTFERDFVDLLVHTARLWRSLGHYDLQSRFRIDGVTGPDEYSAIADNNVYTNLMAARNLLGAASFCEHNQDKAMELGVTPQEIADWRAAADRIFIPYDERLQVHPQAESFTDHEMWDFKKTSPDQYPLMLHFPYFDLYRKQVVKQPDLVFAMQLCSDKFTSDQKARNYGYYERITVRDSSLSACTQAVLAAEVGHLRLALDYVAEAALMDLRDLEHNARDGLHIASLAGTWIALVNGFGGMRDHAGVLSFAPRLPDGLTSMSFSIVRRKFCLHVEVGGDTAKYRLKSGTGTLKIVHHGENLVLSDSESIERPIPPLPQREPPSQPPGREPRRRSPGGVPG